ncbi:MAG: bacterial Ig-like domain-containing protein [Clostridia bacterium]|nr:bacterial Ig-like domain-containing protein [Clostridia bacterium]
MAKDKEKKKIPFNVFRKGMAGALIGATILASGVTLAACGKQGENGKDGADGTIWKSGTNYTEFTDAKVGDFFIDTDDYILYQKGENDWVIVMENYGRPAQVPTFEIDEEGYWTVNGVSTGVKATGESGAKWHHGAVPPTTEGNVGDYYLDTVTYDIYEKTSTGWDKIANIKSSNEEDEAAKKAIGEHYMISDGLKEMAANAVELAVDDDKGIAYACYLASETTLGEATSLVKIAKFNILQPTNVEWIEVFNRNTDFGGQPLLECNIINLNSSTVRVFAVNKSNWKYYYKDVNKATNAVGQLKEVKFKTSDNSDAVEFSKTTVNQYISSISGKAFGELQITTKIIEVDGYFYTTAVGGGDTSNVLFLKSTDGATWTLQSVINQKTNYEAMLAHHDGKFWVFSRDGVTTPTTATKQKLMYSEDGKTWTQSNLALTVSDTRPYLFNYQGDLYLAYSSPMPTDYSTIRNWRCNVHIGKIYSYTDDDGTVKQGFQEIAYKESKFGIVYYALHDWYGNMIMLYSSGEMHPTEGLMGSWSQGKDCLNYTIVHSQEPELSFKKLEEIIITALPNVTTYNVGDTFDKTGLTIRARYNNGSYQTLTTGFDVSSPDMSVKGTQTVVVSYQGKTVTFDITVTEVEKVLQSIEIASQPTKRAYVLGETFDPTGLVVLANFNVGGAKTLSSGEYSLSTPDMSTVGTKQITVTYLFAGTTKVATFEITVSEELLDYVALNSIVADGSQYIDTGLKVKSNTKVVVKMERPTNDDMDASGKWLFSAAANGGQSNLFGLCLKQNDAFVLDMGGERVNTGTINWQDGANTITIAHGEYLINGGALTSANTSALQAPTTSTNNLYILSSPTTSATTYLKATIYEVSIYEGNTLVMHLIPAQQPDGDRKIGFYDTVSGNWIFQKVGSNFVEGEAEVVKALSDIQVTTHPTTTTYALNQAFDPTGLAVTATFEGGSTKVLDSDEYQLSTPDMTTAGQKTITVTCTIGEVTKTTTFNITVENVEKTIQSIAVSTMPTKTSYSIGETFSADGLKVVTKFNLGADEEISGYTLSSPDMSTVGTKTVTVTYEADEQTFTTTFEITVAELPYTALEYVTGTGEQYIDTGLTLKSNTKVVITMDKPSNEALGNGWIVNAGGSSKQLGFCAQANGAYVLDIGGKRYNTGTINWQEGKNTLVIGNGEFTINGGALVSGLNVTATQPSSTSKLMLFTSVDTTNNKYIATNIYSIAIYEGDALVMNLIPAQERDGQTRVGFYDTVSGNWIFSAASGTAFAGPTA